MHSSILAAILLLCLLSFTVESRKLHRTDNESSTNGTQGVVLIAGWHGYEKYRHQADVRHAYQIPKSRGLKDEALSATEADFKVITVMKDGSGNFTTVTDALNGIPMSNANRVIIKIGGGLYWEKITIDRSKKNITFYGDPNDMPKISFNGTAADYNGTLNSATVAVESDYFMAVNIEFVNSAPMPDGKREGAQAVAMRISGDKATFYNCKFIGYQDTLCDDKGKHLFKDCYISGTVDFIFGNGQSMYLNTTLRSVSNKTGVITAQARSNENEKSGFVFVYCNVTGTNETELGRPWKEKARVIFAHTYMDTVVNKEGWSDGMKAGEHKSPYFGEYKCWGPGANLTGRAKFVKNLTDEEARPFLSMAFIDGDNWIVPPPMVP
ncbi:putative pectinesterase 63 [Mangifera indica]|uniref:putative pectinesterase 63 n=1 Tax=Mangifera indica TaxID=29780 RepID=UPI001CF96C8B|nr:putative pectinesterase 63 [Mangifera indica]XP_044496403.1 putative pectinesterase 63 [Mangifera indica]XP_044496404.1 putative pectinesterase 63 [Mangifera indica]